MDGITVDQVMEGWYYDNDTPIGLGDKGAPVFENGFNLCSALTNDQNIAWGTIGFKNKDIVPGIPNTDPLRVGDYDLPPEACEVGQEDTLSYFTVTLLQYYLGVNMTPDGADEMSERAKNPLHRKIRC